MAVLALKIDCRVVPQCAPTSNSYLHGCPCGYYGDSLQACACTDGAIRRYRRRLSGPLLDRIDIHLDVPS